ncbi:MAG TPA: VWA domain-containing protein [Verrucomicrobiales bacterium]|nr:VWA domain-containing protein [Verrucomicrobiales bacterium]
MEDSPFEFARPYWLYAGMGLCAVVVALFFYFDRRRDAALAKLVHSRFRHRLVPGHSPVLLWVKRSLWVLAVLLLSAAAAGPRKGYEWREVKRRGIDILFAVDTSRSMLAEDISPNRLERARMGIHDFLSRLDGDRVGLIPFAGSSLALCPLTTDYDAFRDALDALDTDVIPRQGTDVASAIREAERLFTEQGNNHRILVLITDGEDLQGDVLEEAEAAAKKETKIFTIGVGSPDGALIPLRQQNGTMAYVEDEEGKPVRTKLDEDALKKIAEVTKGLYAPLGRGAEGLDTIYREKLRLVPKNETEQRMEKVPLERFEWPLGAAILLLIMEFLLPDRRRETKTRALPSAARRHTAASTTVTSVVAGLLLALAAQPVLAEESKDPRVLYNEGTEEYTAGHFDKAAESLRASLNTPDLKLQNRAYYNLGNSLYRIGQAQLSESPDKTMKSWEEAIQAYGGSIALDSSDSEARHNQDLVKRKLEQLKKKQDEQKKQDDKKEDKKDEKKDDQKEDQKKDQQDKSEQKDQEKKDQQDKPGQQDQQKEDQKKDGQQDEKSEGEKKPGGSSADQKEGKEDQEKKEGQQGKEEKPEDKAAEKNSTGTGKDSKEDQEKKDAANKEKMQEGKDGEKKDQPQPGTEDKKDEKNGQPQAAEKKTLDGKDPGKDKAAQQAEPAKEGDDKKDQTGEAMQASEERRKPGEMTADEARMLLQALRSDERTVIPVEKPPRQRRFRDPNNTTKGKTW